MTRILHSQNFRFLVYTIFYFLIMVYGLDLIQAQASQILPYLAWVKNPVPYHNDVMGWTFPYYGNYSLWYKGAGYLSQIFQPMSIVYFYFLLQCVFEVFGLRFLSRKLFPDLPELYTWIVIILFTYGGVLRHSLGSVAPFGWTVFPDTLITGILFFALGFMLEKKYFQACIVIALSFYIHLSIALFVFLLVVALFFSDTQKFSLHFTIKLGFTFGVLILPLGITILQNPSSPLTADFDTWFNTIKNYQGMHSFPSQFGLIQYIPFVFWMGLFILSLKRLTNFESRKKVIQFCGIAVGLLFISYIFIELVPLKTIIVLSFFRGSRFILVFAVMCSIALLYQYTQGHAGTSGLFRQMHIRQRLLIGIGAVSILFFIFLNFLIFHPVYRSYPEFIKTKIASLEQSNPEIRNYLFFQTIKVEPEHIAAWKAVQLWCQKNTPENELLLTPYYLRGFRSFSQRGIVFQYRDSQLQVYQQNLTEEIMERADLIGSPLNIYTTPTQYRNALEKLYKTYTVEKIVDLSQIFHFSYIVSEKNHTFNLPLKYSNAFFNVYYLNNEVSRKS